VFQRIVALGQHDRRQDYALPFAEVAEVIDICKKAGIDKIGLAKPR